MFSCSIMVSDLQKGKEEIKKTDDDSPSMCHNDKKRPLVLNLDNLHDISSELSSQGQILSQVVRDIQLHHKVTSDAG